MALVVCVVGCVHDCFLGFLFVRLCVGVLCLGLCVGVCSIAWLCECLLVFVSGSGVCLFVWLFDCVCVLMYWFVRFGACCIVRVCTRVLVGLRSCLCVFWCVCLVRRVHVCLGVCACLVACVRACVCWCVCVCVPV